MTGVQTCALPISGTTPPPPPDSSPSPAHQHQQGPHSLDRRPPVLDERELSLDRRPHITFLCAFYSFLVSRFWFVRLWLCGLGVWFIVSKTSLSEWLFCCIPIFCFSILFLFLLSFGHENFVGFTLCGVRRRVFHCSYSWIWCLYISDLSVFFFF